MPVLLIPNVRTSQPSEPTGIDSSNAVTSGVKLAMRSLADPAMSFGAGTVAHNANSVLRGTAKGLARKYTFSGFAANYSTFSNSPNTAKSCYMLQGIRGAYSASNYFAVIPSAKVGIDTDGRIYFNYAATYNFTTKTIAVGAPFTVFFWGKDHDIVSLDLDGEVITYTDASGWGGVNFIDIIGGDAPNGSSNHTILSVVGWNRYLSAAERVSLRNNPWQVFEPETIPLFWTGVTAQSATASIAAAIRSDRTASASLSAAIQSAATASATLSGAIQTAQSATSGLTAYIVASSARSSSASLSAAISDARTATSSLSAAVATARTATAALDSAIQIEATASTGASAAIREAFSLSANLSGAVQASATASASLAAIVATTGAISAGLSAAVRAEQAAFATLSAYIAADVVLTQAEVDMLTDIWQRFGLDPLAPLTETESAASFGGIVLSKSGTNTITSTRSGNSAAGIASSMILDVWQRLGLDPDNPMAASETQISAGTLSQARAVSGTTVTVTRAP